MALYNKNKKSCKQLWDVMWETFLRFMLLKKTHFGAADPPPTLLPMTIVMLTLFHSMNHCPLFFWYWHLLRQWEIIQTEQIRVFYLLSYSDCYKEWTENLYQSNLSLSRDWKKKKKKRIGRLWHHVLKWKWIWTLCSPVCWHYGESSWSVGENEVWQRHTERSPSRVPIF